MKLLIFLLLLCGEASSQVFTGNAVRFRGRPLTACVPATGEVYVWSGTSWDCGGAGGGGTNGGGNFSASGAPAATSITKIHNGNTTAVIVQCAEDVGGAEVFGTLDRSSATQTTVNFSPALANATTCVFVTGAGSGSAVADQTILGNISGGSATPIGLTAAQVLTLTNAVAGKSGLTTANLIPYVSAAGTLNQSTTKLNGGIFYPTSDSTTAIQFNKADGTTNVLTVDTTNARVGIGAVDAVPFTVVGQVNATTFNVRTNNVAGMKAADSGGTARLVFSVDNTNQLAFGDTAGYAKVSFFAGRSVATITALNTGPVGIGTSNTSPSGTLSILDATATTGSTATWIGHDGSATYSTTHTSEVATTLNVVAGKAQSSADLFTTKTTDGVNLFRLGSAGAVFISNATDTLTITPNNGGGKATLSTSLDIQYNAALHRFQTTGGSQGTLDDISNIKFNGDTSLSRISAGIIGVGTGATGSFAGTLKLTTEILAPVAVGSLPASPVQGMRAFVTDSNAASCTVGIGSVVAAGGSTVCPVFYDGTNWRIG